MRVGIDGRRGVTSRCVEVLLLFVPLFLLIGYSRTLCFFSFFLYLAVFKSLADLFFVLEVS